jgi:hypothetical protein
MILATLVIKATGKKVCGLCAPLDSRQVRLLMTSETGPAGSPADSPARD